jgi:hypothetical protein
MALIDDIEFYGRAVDAGELPRQQAAELLARDSCGGLTVLGAARSIDDWNGMRERMQTLHADTVDTLRAITNGKPVPEHVRRHNRERAKAELLRSLQRIREHDWEDDSRESGRRDRDYWERDEA